MKKPRLTYRKKRKLNLKRSLLLLISAAVIGLSVFSFSAEYLSGNPLPMPFGCGAAVVLSGSMEPALSSGDIVLVRQAETINVGDIVVYQFGHSLVVHRVTGIAAETVTTKGDANNAEDTPFPRSAVKGIVVCSIPLLGYAVQAIKTPVGVLILMAAAILLLELSYRADRRRQENEIAKLKAELRSLQSRAEAPAGEKTEVAGAELF